MRNPIFYILSLLILSSAMFGAATDAERRPVPEDPECQPCPEERPAPSTARGEIRHGTTVGYVITSHYNGTRHTNLTFDGSTSFIRKDAETVDAYRIWSDRPAFTTFAIPVGAMASSPEYDRPRTALFFDSDRLDYLGLLPEGPREGATASKPVVRSYWYPHDSEVASYLPRIDPPLYTALAPLHLGFENRTYTHWNGAIEQTVAESSDGLTVRIRTVGSPTDLDATLVYDNASFPLRGEAAYTMVSDGHPLRLSWRFERTELRPGTGDLLTFGDAPAVHGRYDGPTTPLLAGPLHLVGPTFWHPGKEAFGVPGYDAALATVMRDPEFQSLVASSDELILQRFDWDRYALPYLSYQGQYIPPDLGDQSWTASIHGYLDGQRGLKNHAVVRARMDGQAVDPLPTSSLTNKASSMYDRSDLPPDYAVAPVEQAVQRFFTEHEFDSRLDEVGWWVQTASTTTVYWTIATGCDRDKEEPSTVIIVDASTLDARFAYYAEDYSGWNACNPGVIPPLY